MRNVMLAILALSAVTAASVTGTSPAAAYDYPYCVQGRGVGGALLSRLIEAVPAARGAVAIEYIFGNDRAAAVYAHRGFVEVRRDPADQPGWPDQVWAELTLPATSTPA